MHHLRDDGYTNTLMNNMKVPYGRSEEAHKRRQERAIKKLKERQNDITSVPRWTLETTYINLTIMADMIKDGATIDELARYFGRKYWSIEKYKKILKELEMI